MSETPTPQSEPPNGGGPPEIPPGQVEPDPDTGLDNDDFNEPPGVG